MTNDSFESIYSSSQEECPSLKVIPSRKRRRLSRFVYDRTIYYANKGFTEDQILHLVKEEAEKEYGYVILLAIIAAVVQFLVLKILRWLWPDKAM